MSNQKEKVLSLIQAVDWSTLFRKNCKVYIDYGNVILKVQQLYDDHVVTEVTQGGTFVNNSIITMPETKKVASIFDLAFVNINEILSLNIDYVIIPGIASARELSVIIRKLERLRKIDLLFLFVWTERLL